MKSPKNENIKIMKTDTKNETKGRKYKIIKYGKNEN